MQRRLEELEVRSVLTPDSRLDSSAVMVFKSEGVLDSGVSSCRFSTLFFKESREVASCARSSSPGIVQ